MGHKLNNDIMIRTPPKRGIALVVVLVLLATMMLMVTSLSTMMWQQQERAHIQQDYQQAMSYSASVESLALSILSRSLKKETRVHLGQEWASGPRLFHLPQGKVVITLQDAQACFNLNVFSRSATTSRSLAVQQLIALLLRLEVPINRAEKIAENLREFIDTDTRQGREDREYGAQTEPFYTANQPLADISEMRIVKGMDADIYRKMKPLVCVLPMNMQQININTLDISQSTLLEALFDPWLTSVQASVLLQQRPAEGWKDVDQFLSNPILTRVDEYTKRRVKDVLVVQSNYFWLRSDITVNETELTMNSLIARQGPQYFSVQRHHTGDSE